MPSPLAQVRVLDLTRILAGPYCTMLLGDLGAEVIKIERPGSGDDTRLWGPPFAGGESAYFLCCNRNKKSVTVNLKSPAGRNLIADLADRSDILVENFLPGTLEEWGLSYETLSRRNPRLVYCSLTGFGQTGPRRDEPGYDIMIQALSGVMSITGEPDGPPTKLGVAISDITAGMFAAQAILAALYARERTGRGDRVETALFDSTLAWLANQGSNYLVSGEIPERRGSAHPSIVPYQMFAAADQALIVAVGNDAQFVRFCEVIGHPEWSQDDRFATNAQRVRHRETLIPLIASVLATRPATDWIADLEKRGVPCGPVNTIAQAFADPQVAARDMLWEIPHPTIGPLRLAGSPIKLAGHSPPRQPPPRLGEHTREVLTTILGLSDADLERLRQSQVV
jgi:formyl-CoA transferase